MGTAFTCSEAALMIPLFQACGTTATPCSSASAAIRIISVIPPHRVTSGWIRSTCPRSISSRKPQRVASCSPAAIVSSTVSASSA